jgi:hypothetical protein
MTTLRMCQSALLTCGILLIASLPVEAQGQEKTVGFTYAPFDGTSLHGWVVENDCEITVDDGCILLKSGDGWLRSHHTCRDFALHVEWKAEKAADYDAGIYIRTPGEGKPFPKNGYQVNLLQGKEGNIGNLPGAASTGLVKPGEWNSFDITVVGDTVALVINGKPAYKVGGLKNASGYIGLQCEVPKGGQFRFRNFRLTEFGYKSLFNGTDLTGWTGGGAPAEICWEVQDGLLLCNGAKKGPWLRSNEEYADFDLRFDYQVSPGGNSGVYVRVPENGNHHRENEHAPPAGFEVQVLDDAAAQYRNLKDYQYCGGVYDIAGPTKRVSRPAGEWNTMEIQCKGQHVVVTHNGVVVVDCDEEKYPLLKLRQTKGFLGLQNHSTLVKFRNLRIAAE